MVTIKELREKTMTENKRREAKNDIFAFYVGRPISYVLTLPCLMLKIKPNTISLISLIFSILGFVFLSFGKTKVVAMLGMIFFLMWNFFDGVDGNIARYTNQTSKLGKLWDAAAGYTALALMLFSIGSSATNLSQRVEWLTLDRKYFLLMGGLASILTLLPRLIMHQKTIIFGDDSAKFFNDKGSFSFIKIVFLNILSPSGFMQVFMLIAIIFDLTNLFVIFYFLLELLVGVYSYFKLLR